MGQNRVNDEEAAEQSSKTTEGHLLPSEQANSENFEEEHKIDPPGISLDVNPTLAKNAMLARRDTKKLVKYFREDEYMHTAGVLNVLLNVVVAFRFPEYYFILYAVEAIVLLTWRYRRFQKRKEELFLLDFCYFVTYFTVAGCIAAFFRIAADRPDAYPRVNLLLVRAGFTFANGVLAWSIVIFRNAIIFHSIDHMTSVFIHLGPAVLFYCLRWGSGFGPGRVADAWHGAIHVCPTKDDYDRADTCGILWCKPSICRASFLELIVYPIIVYLILWAIPFSIIMFGCLRGYVERNAKVTLFKELLEDESKNQFLRLFPSMFQPLAYMFQHLVTVAFFGLISYLLWHSFLLHTIFLALISIVAVHNGSTWLFRIFALRYAGKKYKTHRLSLDSLRERHFSMVIPVPTEESYADIVGDHEL